MKRFEYTTLCRVVVKANTREEADEAHLKARLEDFVVGKIVTAEQDWWNLPGENYVEAESETLRKAIETFQKLSPEPNLDPDRLDPVKTVQRLARYMDANPEISQSKIARTIETSIGSLRGWCLGKWKPGPTWIAKIHKFLDGQEFEG